MKSETRKPRSGALDAVLGGRIRQLRRNQNMSQTVLGEKLGITFQQVQKYENGANRVSALMLLKLAEALSVSPIDLLNDLDPEVEHPVAVTPGASKLLADFSRIKSKDLQQIVLNLTASLAVL